MEKEKLLSALCYFSLFFAPFLLPIVVFILTDSIAVKGHAKAALLSHLFPVITIGIFIFALFSGFYLPEWNFFLVFWGFAILFGTINLLVTVWNVVRGIRVLM